MLLFLRMLIVFMWLYNLIVMCLLELLYSGPSAIYYEVCPGHIGRCIACEKYNGSPVVGRSCHSFQQCPVAVIGYKIFFLAVFYSARCKRIYPHVLVAPVRSEELCKTYYRTFSYRIGNRFIKFLLAFFILINVLVGCYYAIGRSDINNTAAA